MRKLAYFYFRLALEVTRFISILLPKTEAALLSVSSVTELWWEGLDCVLIGVEIL